MSVNWRDLYRALSEGSTVEAETTSGTYRFRVDEYAGLQVETPVFRHVAGVLREDVEWLSTEGMGEVLSFEVLP